MTDLGVRCDAHIGEVFPPRCVACQTLTTEYKNLERFGIHADVEPTSNTQKKESK